MPENRQLSSKLLSEFKENFDMDPRCQVLKHAIIKNGIQNVSLNNDSIISMQYAFSDEIKTGKITSQQQSGRCWLFAGLNMFRQKVARTLKIKDFELSTNYPLFWDKLEKSNYFLEKVIETAQEDMYSRTFMWLLKNPVQDGGQWDMFANLVEKYGIVPKVVMPETFHSSNTKIMQLLLTSKLREGAWTLRTLFQQGKQPELLREKKGEIMEDIYRILVLFLGQPPLSFDYEYRDDEGNFNEDNGLTPIVFYQKYVGYDLHRLVSVINAPSSRKPFNQTYTVDSLGNLIEGKPIIYLNIDIDTMKQLVLKQLREGIPVWFGCDVGKMVNRETGIMDTDIYLYEKILGVKFGLSKGGRLDYGESQLTHAMVFTGVNVNKGVPNRWKVENSWGEQAGNQGFFVMSDSWFDEFNYQVVIFKKFLPDNLLAVLKQDPVVLPPWDPMGALALMQ
ncbi:C1 family peptidase [candidate division CSSED10-310 bacterium]|uniref:Aminopeptidase n=1 Tax=candidate division CSSED10-310 bacterium TaxID=2855610 RepID=A0ABV6YXQ1_UNCC1